MSPRQDAIHVLHVDDDEDFADMAAIFLEREDDRFTVTTVHSASDGLDVLTADEIDCIVSDYDMPGQTGLQFLEAVRDEYPDIPFILFTGKGSEDIASDAISAGVTDYLQKRGSGDQYTLLANRISNAIERMDAQRERRRSDRRFKAVFEDPDSVIAILDPDGTVRDVNQTALARVDAEREDVLGEPFCADPWWTDDQQPTVQKWIDKAAAGEYVDFEAAHTTPDGREWHVSATLRPVEDEAGTIVSLIASGRDITERKEYEAELQQKTRAMDEAPVGITLSDPSQDDNPLVYVNKRFTDMTGYDESDVLGRNCRFLQGDETDPERVTEMREAIDAREPVVVELQNYRKDGTKFWNRVTIEPVWADDGELLNFIGFQEDITEQKQ